MIDPSVVDLSRLQFAATALYHFLFVPLTLGLSWLLVAMEAAYVMSGNSRAAPSASPPPSAWPRRFP